VEQLHWAVALCLDRRACPVDTCLRHATLERYTDSEVRADLLRREADHDVVLPGLALLSSLVRRYESRTVHDEDMGVLQHDLGPVRLKADSDRRGVQEHEIVGVSLDPRTGPESSANAEVV